LQSHSWITFALAIAGWVGTGGVVYGLLRGKVDSLSHRVERLEESRIDLLPRSEYNARHEDLKERLERIEHKLDEKLNR